MEVVEYKYFLKIYTLLQIWWWRHDDVIILTSYWRKSLPNRIELSAAATFERNKMESCMTPHFLANALGFTKKRFPTIRYGIIISCHQLIEAKIFDLGENLVWRHNDVIRPQILTKHFQNVYLVIIQVVSKYKVDWSIFGETVPFLIFSQFVWNFLPSSDENPRTPILGMQTA